MDKRERSCVETKFNKTTKEILLLLLLLLLLIIIMTKMNMQNKLSMKSFPLSSLAICLAVLPPSSCTPAHQLNMRNWEKSLIS